MSAEIPLGAVAVITAVPGAAAVIFPLVSTVATEESEELQVKGIVPVPLLGLSKAFKVVLSPGFMETADALKMIVSFLLFAP
jgi:hypothetical protein